MPDGINLPTGRVKLPAEPVEIQGATIVVTNTDLLPYLTDAVLPAPTTGAQQAIATAYNHARERARQQLALAVSTPSVSQPKPALPANIEPPSHSAEPLKGDVAKAVVPVPVRPTATQASTTTTIAPVTQRAEQNAISYDAVNRAICASMPSLGEAAQCFNQLKRATATNPQK